MHAERLWSVVATMDVDAAFDDEGTALEVGGPRGNAGMLAAAHWNLSAIQAMGRSAFRHR